MNINFISDFFLHHQETIAYRNELAVISFSPLKLAIQNVYVCVIKGDILYHHLTITLLNSLITHASGCYVLKCVT